MKNIFVTFLLLLSLNSFSQKFKYPSSNNGFGLKAGINYSIISMSVNNDMSFKRGAVFGIYCQARISDQSAFVPEMVFSMQGCKNKYVNYDGLVLGESQLNLNYLSFPLIFKTYITKGLNIHYGPQIGVLVMATEKGVQYQYDYSSSTPVRTGAKLIDENFIEEFKPAEVLLVGGIGYDLPFRTQISFRLSKGITNIAPPGYLNNTPIPQKKLSNVVLQFSVGYVFPVTY
jgi:hypothetical protein